MIRSKCIPEILSQCLSGDEISLIMLINKDGALLGSSGSTNKTSNKVIGAIAANVWNEYEMNDKKNQIFVQKSNEPDIKEGTHIKTQNNELHLLLIDLENAKMAVADAGFYLICIYGSVNTPTGIIKAKINSLSRYFKETLKDIQ